MLTWPSLAVMVTLKVPLEVVVPMRVQVMASRLRLVLVEVSQAVREKPGGSPLAVMVRVSPRSVSVAVIFIE